MPLFRCQNPKCQSVENSALSLCSWTAKIKLCSECCPKQKKWHGKFPKDKEMPLGEEDIFKPQIL